jgi:hypothetical protein
MEQLTLIDGGPTVIDLALTQPDFVIDHAIQQRQRMDPATVEEYTQLYREGRDLGRITVFADKAAGCFWLADGFHRCEAATQAGLTTLPAVVYPGARREALLYATSCNLHGKARSNADKKKSVLSLLQDAEWGLWSDNHIAKHTGVSQPFVSQLRKSLLTVRSEPGERAPHPSPTRQYLTKHGTAATMQVGAIGQHGARSPLEVEAPRGESCPGPLADPESSSDGIGPMGTCTTPAAASGSPSPAPLLQDTSVCTPPTPEAPPSAEPTLAQRFHRALESLEALATAIETADLGTVQTAYAVPCATILVRCRTLLALLQPTPATAQVPQAGLTARVWAQLQAYGTNGATGATVAKALDAPYQKVWKALTRFVTQGKATKQGTTYMAHQKQGETES